MKNISVRVDDDFHKKVADQAKEQDMALSDFVRASLQAMCRHNDSVRVPPDGDARNAMS